MEEESLICGQIYLLDIINLLSCCKLDDSGVSRSMSGASNLTCYVV